MKKGGVNIDRQNKNIDKRCDDRGHRCYVHYYRYCGVACTWEIWLIKEDFTTGGMACVQKVGGNNFCYANTVPAVNKKKILDEKKRILKSYMELWLISLEK